MRDRFFLDTNVLVYSFESSQPAKKAIALTLIKEGISSNRGVISYQIVQEFLNVAFKKFNTPLTVEDARLYYRKVLSPLAAINSSKEIFQRALSVKEDFKFGWYDCLVIAAALEAGCKELFSEDLSHGQFVDSLRITNPFA